MEGQVRSFTFVLISPDDFIPLAIELLNESGLTYIEHEILGDGPIDWLRLSARGQQRLSNMTRSLWCFAREVQI